MGEADLLMTEKKALDFDLEFVGHLTNQESFSYIYSQGISTEMILDPSCRAIYAFAKEYYEKHGRRAPTSQVLAEEFDVEIEESIHPVEYVVSNIREKYQRVRVQDLLRKAAVTLKNDSTMESLKVLQQESSKILFESSPKDSVSFIDQNPEERLNRYLERARGKGVRGVSLGFEEIDDYTLGLHPSELAIIVASPKTGKSFLVMKLGYKQALEGNSPYIASLENATTMMEDRLDCLASEVGGEKYRRGELSKGELERVKAAQASFQDLEGRIVLDQPPVGSRTVASMFQRALTFGCDCLLIDQLSWVEPRKNWSNPQDVVKEIVIDLHNYGQKYHLPVVMAAQFNRTVAFYRQMGKMNQIAMSSWIEQTADMVFALHQTPEMRNNRIMQIGLIGSRRTDIGGWELEWSLKNRTRLEVRRMLDPSEM